MRRALGRGLSQLLSESEGAANNELSLAAISPNPRQPRGDFDSGAIEDLAASIRAHGVLQPIVVRELGGGRYELIAGERRWRAAKLAGLKSIPATIRRADPQTSLELAIVENVQREDIGPIEEAEAYQQLAQEFGLTQDKIAERVGKSRAAVSNSIRLLKLPDQVIQALREGRLTEGHARVVLSADGPTRQIALAKKIEESGMSVREAEAATKAPQQSGRSKPKAKTDVHTRSLQEQFEEGLGLPVVIQRKPDGSGKLTVAFYSDEDLERLAASMGIEF